MAAPAAAPRKLMAFGGMGHQTYLGCLNCGTASTDSVLNPSGPFGHCMPLASGPSMFCHGIFDDFGSSAMFKTYSACSATATDPPAVVDQNGKYYARFSVSGNSIMGHADSVCDVMSRGYDEAGCKLVKYVCKE